jgi:uncharacterized phage infection (PIP) family protein YhgE
MSKLMYFQTKHVVETVCTGRFNWGMDTFHDICDALNIEYTIVNDDCPEYDENFEISKASVKDAVKALKKMEKGIKPRNIDVEELTDSLEKVNMTVTELRELFETMLKKGEKNSDYIFINFF